MLAIYLGVSVNTFICLVIYNLIIYISGGGIMSNVGTVGGMLLEALMNLNLTVAVLLFLQYSRLRRQYCLTALL